MLKLKLEYLYLKIKGKMQSVMEILRRHHYIRIYENTIN